MFILMNFSEVHIYLWNTLLYPVSLKLLKAEIFLFGDLKAEILSILVFALAEEHINHHMYSNLASAGTESNAAAADIVEHLERALLHVAEDSSVAILAHGREREAATVENAGDVEVHDGAAGERQCNLGQP